MKGRSLIVYRLFLIINFPLSSFGQKKYEWTDTTSTQTSICKEKECLERAKLIAKSINKNADPCQDFYEYACGNWEKANPIPSNQYEWSIETKLDFKSIKEMSDMLKTSTSYDDSEDVKQAKRLYNICNNFPALPNMAAKLLKAYVKRAGPWPMFSPDQKTKVSWSDIHNHYLKAAGDAGIFGFSLRYEQKSNEVSIQLGPPSMPIGLIQRVGEWGNDEIHKHQQLILLLARMVADKINEPPEKDLLQDIADVVAFRQKLKNIRSETVEFSPMTIKYLNMWYNVKVAPHKAGIKISWVQLFQILFRDTDFTINEDTKIMIQNKESFANFPRLLSTTPKHVIANHLHLYFIERHILFDEEINNALNKLLIHNGKVIGTPVSRWDRSDACIFSHPLKETLAKMYVSKHFNEKTRDKAFYYANKMIDVIKLHITGSTWLDDSTQALLLDKLSNIDLNMGYRNTHWEPHAQQKDLKMTPYRAMSFYLPKENSVFISAGYFRAPVYGPDLPSAVTYSTLGTFIAYEIYHALSAHHAHMEPITSRGVCRYCFSDIMLEVYEKKTKCFVDLYTDLVDKDLEKIKPLPKTVGTNTLLENIADIMGIRAGMDAFKKRLWESKGKCRILPHLKDLTCEKLFFLSYAVTYCTVSPPWSMLKHMQLGTHSLSRFRVNVPLSIMKEFQEAYQCPANSPMVSKKSCALW